MKKFTRNDAAIHAAVHAAIASDLQAGISAVAGNEVSFAILERVHRNGQPRGVLSFCLPGVTYPKIRKHREPSPFAKVRRDLRRMPSFMAKYLAHRPAREVRILLKDWADNIITGLPR